MLQFKHYKGKENNACSEYEICVLCGGLTDVLRDCPIEERKNYVSGGGQLCNECFGKLYHLNDIRTI